MKLGPLAVAIPSLLLAAGTSLSGCCHRGPISLRTSSGAEASDFRLHDSLHFEAERLAPRTTYQVRVVRESGATVTESALSTDGAGRIPESVLWYDIGVRPCARELPLDAALLARAEIAEPDRPGAYRVQVLQGTKLLHEAAFRVEARSRPRVYATDARGCPKTGFLIGEEDVWVVGRDLPKGSLVRLWAVGDDWRWKDGSPLRDSTGQFGSALPPLFELGPQEGDFLRLLWPRGHTSVGSYDVVAEVVSYPFGRYRAAPRAEALDLVSNLSYAGFVVQRRQGAGQPLEQDAAGVRQSKLVFRNSFLTSENVFVGVDPFVHPTYIGKSARVFIVAHRTDAEWTVDRSLVDVTGGVETVTIQPGGCANCYSTLAWAAPLTAGRYDVVLDFDMDGLYTPGVDLIDSLDPVGFHVSSIRVDTVSFAYPGSGSVVLYDEAAGVNVAPPEYAASSGVVRPAAWTMGGSHQVRVTFRADPGVSSARVWAESSVVGLASAAAPQLVAFAGGNGEATFAAGAPPAWIGQHQFDWSWRYRDLNGAASTPAEMGLSGRHVLFTLLDTPRAPQAIPWLGALGIAADLAYGRSTALEATRDIWQDFYASAGAVYDTMSGAPRYTGSTVAAFNLSAWLANYRAGSIGTVNCYDMGKAVVVFANALGANTEYVYVNPFGLLNCVRPVGRSWANNPFYDNPGCPGGPIVPGDSARCGFGNHGFSRLDAGVIFDASGGQVDVDGDPDDCPPATPLDLAGHDSWSSYRAKVVDFTPASSPGNPVPYAFSVQ